MSPSIPGLPLTAILIGTLSFGCETKKIEKPVEIIRPVRTMKISATGGQRMRTFSGVTQAGMESKLSFMVGGTIRALRVKVGQKVVKGQLIAEIDDKDFRLQVQQAQAAHAQARAQEINARASYDRTRKLYETQNASKSDLDAARAGFASAQAAVSSAAKQISLARSKLGYARLRSPLSGAISLVAAEVNENVQPGQAVVVLSSGGLPEVKVTVPEVLIAKIKSGASATVHLDAIKGQSFVAVVTEVGVATEAMGSTYPVVVRIEKPSEAIRPGMAAEVRFQLGSKDGPERFLVPPVAVGQDRKGRFVYVAVQSAPGRAIVRRKEVEVGELTSEGIEILKGLANDELLITAGVSKIRDGLRVKLMGGQNQ